MTDDDEDVTAEAMTNRVAAARLRALLAGQPKRPPKPDWLRYPFEAPPDDPPTTPTPTTPPPPEIAA